MQLPIILTTALATSFAIQGARAEPIQARFTAVVTSTSLNPELPALGTTIKGTITFDYPSSSSGPISDCGPGCKIYSYSSAPYQYFVDLVSSTISIQHGGIAVSDDTSFPNSPSPTKDVVEFTTKSQATGYNLTLSGPSSSFSGTAIPPKEQLIDLAQDGYFYIMSPSLEQMLGARVTSFSMSPVPEPSTVFLLSFGLIGIVGMRVSARRVSSSQD